MLGSCYDPLPNMVLAGRGDAVRSEVWTVDESACVPSYARRSSNFNAFDAPQNASKPTPTVNVCKFTLQTFILLFEGGFSRGWR